MHSVTRRALSKRAWRSVAGRPGAARDVARCLASAAVTPANANGLNPVEECTYPAASSKVYCKTLSGNIAIPFSTNQNPLFYTGRGFTGVVGGRDILPGQSHGTTLNLRYTSTRFETTAAEAAPVEKYEYQAEVSRLMDLIVNSLYSNKEVFLRELVSNSSDALDKLRFLSVTDPSLLEANPSLEIRIKPDRDAATLTIMDTGVGMTREELVESLGTIAHSGTAKFLKALKENQQGNKDNNLIGQFGVGFYSSFLVADKVTVSTKSAKSNKQYVWEGEADTSSYTIKEETDPEKFIPRGTTITLHLKDAQKYEFASPTKIQSLIKNYSQFISFPIYTWQEKTKEVEKSATEDTGTKAEKDKKKPPPEKYWDWELSNDTKPIWMRSSKKVTKDEYDAFYKSTFKEYMDPQAYTHFTTEGEIEFKSLLFIPPMAPLQTEEMWHSRKGDVRLYVKRVFISDQFTGELLPRYLSFIKGVVDSNDLPLNVSREILQQSRIVKMMKQRLVRKTFDMMDKLAKDDDEEVYKKFWEAFGRNLKMGCTEDKSNHNRIAPLLRFYSSKSEDSLLSLDQYVKRMQKKQKEIYFLAAESITSAKNAPFVEDLLKRDLEVLYLVEPIDEVALSSLSEYKGHKFVDISKEDLELGGEEDKAKEEEMEKEYQALCEWMTKSLGEKVAKVQVSKRRTSSPCVLVSAKFGWSANMERIMKAQTFGDETKSFSHLLRRRTLEINPNHSIIKDLNAMFNDSPSSSEADKLVDLLFETAHLSSGFTPENPAEFGGRVYEMMGLALAGKRNSADVKTSNDSNGNSVAPEEEKLAARS